VIRNLLRSETARSALAREALEQAHVFVTPPQDDPDRPRADATDAGVVGNGRLTAVTGAVLLVLLAAEGVTILDIEGMISLHIIFGLLLVGPVALKTLSTVYRFVRYYTRSGPYVRKGPPHPVLRILGPVVIVFSLAVIGTGIALGLVGPDHREPLLTLHQTSFGIWIGAMTLHVVGHAWHAGIVARNEIRDTGSSPAGRRRVWRLTAVAASLVVGVALITGLMPAMHAWIDRPARDHVGRLFSDNSSSVGGTGQDDGLRGLTTIRS